MPARPTPLVAGNWKMNGLTDSLGEAEALAALLASAPAKDAQVAICPPATLLMSLREKVSGSGILTGGQDCHTGSAGAHTGDISARMLADAGASFVIVGHSERRADHGETDALVRAKAEVALAEGLVPIVCVGETEAERREGRELEVVEGQLAGSLPDIGVGQDLVVAYEPVWAIGTGLTPTAEDIAGMHAHVRSLLIRRYGAAGEHLRILYGGSVKPGNAAEILTIPNVDGGLVGGASLLAKDFFAIISAL